MGATYREEDPFSLAKRQRQAAEAAYWEAQWRKDMSEQEHNKRGAIDGDYRVLNEDEVATGLPKPKISE